MKKVFVFLFALLLSWQMNAQDFLVYITKGDITVDKGGTKERLAPGMIIHSSSHLTISSESRLVILSEKDKVLHTLKGPSSDQLGTLIKNENSSTQKLTESYLSFVKRKITDSGEYEDKNYRQSAATSYRETDTLLLNILVPEQKTDTTKETTTLQSNNQLN